MPLFLFGKLAENCIEHFGVPAHITGPARSAMVREKAGEAIGSLLSAAGAAWLALRITGFAYAYVPFLLSSLILSVHFYRTKQGWVMIQQIFFAVINLAGVYCWIFSKT